MEIIEGVPKSGIPPYGKGGYEGFDESIS